ncbi:MAG: DNA-processing protein DprA [Candidatus Competibacteraceae bacterium]|nr:DNA-processing protein DprA [Candidatus Competibacteraceae bacterium]
MLSLTPDNALWPCQLSERLGDSAPRQLWAIGNLALLNAPKTALFCSARCPGDALLRAYDTAAQLRDQGQTVISGFHSPVEKECLRILLRGSPSLILCPARSLNGMRLPGVWRTALTSGRLLLLSPFEATPHRPTLDSARCRNQLVAALADLCFIAHISPGGQMEALSARMKGWSVPAIEL